MLLDDLREDLKTIEPDIVTIKTYWEKSGIEKEYSSLDAQANKEDFWKHPEQAEISKNLHALKQRKEQYITITSLYEEIPELIDLFAEDETELEKLKIDIKRLKKSVSLFKVS
ncbi:hypothetical protein KAR91_76505, partial [Candidatus Pacearchaeota archaeon]|nr:hypothetical protein [Candidatus Pacearchaeota archaeon]